VSGTRPVEALRRRFGAYSGNATGRLSEPARGVGKLVAGLSARPARRTRGRERHPAIDAKRRARLPPFEYANMIGEASSVMRQITRRSGQVLAPTRPSAAARESGRQSARGSPFIKFAPRESQPFTRSNCAALPESLLESELFGTKRRLTGAHARKEGSGLRASQEVTLFLTDR